MMTGYKTKSIIVSKSGSGNGIVRPCMVSLFNVANPHKSGKEPWKILDFKKIEEVVISGTNVRFLLAGSDVLIDGIKGARIDKKDKRLIIKIRK